MACQFASKPYAPAFLFFSASSAGLAALALGVPELLLQVQLAFVCDRGACQPEHSPHLILTRHVPLEAWPVTGNAETMYTRLLQHGADMRLEDLIRCIQRM